MSWLFPKLGDAFYSYSSPGHRQPIQGGHATCSQTEQPWPSNSVYCRRTPYSYCTVHIFSALFPPTVYLRPAAGYSHASDAMRRRGKREESSAATSTRIGIALVRRTRAISRLGHLALWIDSRSGWWLCSAPLRVKKETTVSIHPSTHQTESCI